MAADGPDGGQLLLLAEPLLDLDRLLVHHEDVDGEVFERLVQSAAGSLQWPTRRVSELDNCTTPLGDFLTKCHFHRHMM